MKEIKLNFVNKSNDQNNSEVVIFQKNVNTDFDELAIAWKVIKNCGTGWHHKFNLPMQMKVSANDSYGNEIVDPISARNGQLFHVYKSLSGDQLDIKNMKGSVGEVQLLNELKTGAISANIYKDGKLLARKTGVSPGQKAAFHFKPIIWIGVVSQVVEGVAMSSAILSAVNTQLTLNGISSADIVMRGGGTGVDATAFKFSLENISYG